MGTYENVSVNTQTIDTCTFHFVFISFWCSLKRLFKHATLLWHYKWHRRHTLYFLHQSHIQTQFFWIHSDNQTTFYIYVQFFCFCFFFLRYQYSFYCIDIYNYGRCVRWTFTWIKSVGRRKQERGGGFYWCHIVKYRNKNDTI